MKTKTLMEEPLTISFALRFRWSQGKLLPAVEEVVRQFYHLWNITPFRFQGMCHINPNIGLLYRNLHHKC